MSTLSIPVSIPALPGFRDPERYLLAIRLIGEYFQDQHVLLNDKEKLFALVSEIGDRMYRDGSRSIRARDFWIENCQALKDSVPPSNMNTVPASFFEAKVFEISDAFIENKAGITGVKNIAHRETDIQYTDHSRIKTRKCYLFGLHIAALDREVEDYLDGRSMASTGGGKKQPLMAGADGRPYVWKDGLFKGLVPK